MPQEATVGAEVADVLVYSGHATPTQAGFAAEGWTAVRVGVAAHLDGRTRQADVS